MSGWAASLPATERTRPRAQDRSLWESAEQRQALGIQRAQTGSGALYGTGTPRQSGLRLSHSNRGGQCCPQETLRFPHCLILCLVQGFSVLWPVDSFAESGDTQHWFRAACHFPETRGTGLQALKQLRPIFRSCTKFSQLFLLLLLVLLHLKLHTLAQGSPPPGNLP